MLFLPSDITGPGLSPKAGGHRPLVISEALFLALSHTSMLSLSHIHLCTLIHVPHTLTLTFSHICLKRTISHTYAFSPDICYTNPLALIRPSKHTAQSHTHTHPPTDPHLHVCTLIAAHSHIHVLTDGHLRIMHTAHSL